jgi:uncharacterized coiled-coil protein SlyX
MDRNSEEYRQLIKQQREQFDALLEKFHAMRQDKDNNDD